MVLRDSFIKCVNECFEKGEMSNSKKQAVITLIEKKGKDRSLLENWRPISLVNVDTKLMTKAIAWRIKKVLPDIIHQNQTGMVAHCSHKQNQAKCYNKLKILEIMSKLKKKQNIISYCFKNK